jgi:chromosome segregation ATPase
MTKECKLKKQLTILKSSHRPAIKYLKNLLALQIISLCFYSVAGAQTSAQDGLSKLKANLENSKTNLTEYQKNLKVVDDNVNEVAKAKANVDKQKMDLNKSLQENQQSLAGVEKQEGEINALIKEEQAQLTSETQKLAEIEKLSLLIRENQKKRQANILAYQEQLKQNAQEKGEWKGRTDKLTKAQADLNTKIQSLSNQENEWRGKKRGYEAEVNRWQKEVERNKKLSENYSALAEP